MGFQRRFYLQVQAILSRRQIMFCYCSTTLHRGVSYFFFFKNTARPQGGGGGQSARRALRSIHSFGTTTLWNRALLVIMFEVRLSVAEGPVESLWTNWEWGRGWALRCCTWSRRRTNKRIARCTSIMSRKPEIMLDVHPPRLSLWDPSAVHSRIQLAAVWITVYDDFMHNSWWLLGLNQF